MDLADVGCLQVLVVGTDERPQLAGAGRKRLEVLGAGSQVLKRDHRALVGTIIRKCQAGIAYQDWLLAALFRTHSNANSRVTLASH